MILNANIRHMQLFRTKKNKQTTSLPRREKYTISKPERENVTDRKHFEGRVGLYERPLILPEFGLVEGHEAKRRDQRYRGGSRG